MTIVGHPVSAQSGQPPAAVEDATRAAARQLATEGIEAYESRDFGDAEVKLAQAYQLFPTPTLALWLGRALVKRGRWVEAAERYRDAARLAASVGDVAAQKKAQDDAALELDALLPRIPSLVVRVENADPTSVSVTMDERPLVRQLFGVARPTDPGTHRLVATSGSQRIEHSVTLAEKERTSVPFVFDATLAALSGTSPSASAPPAAAVEPSLPTPAAIAATTAEADRTRTQNTSANILRPVAVVALSLSAVGFVTWGVGALVADNKLDDCPVDPTDGMHACSNEANARSYRRAVTVATVGFWSGALLAVGGASAWLLSTGSDDVQQSSALRWGLTAQGVAVRGKF